MRIVDYRGKWCLEFRVDGERKRKSLGNLDVTDNASRCPNYPAAERAAALLERQFAQPQSELIKDIFEAYVKDSRGISTERNSYTKKALFPFFGNLTPQDITRQKCREYVALRQAQKRKDGTIIKELSMLRAAVNWYKPKSGAVLELPRAPEPKERWLTKAEFQKLLSAAEITPHLVLFLHLAIATGARKEALLSLTWPQIRWEQRQIWLGYKPGGKKRATVPMTDAVELALKKAKRGALTEFVIEFNETRILSIKRSFASACRRAGLGTDVTPHVLRHSAGVWYPLLIGLRFPGFVGNWWEVLGIKAL